MTDGVAGALSAEDLRASVRALRQPMAAKRAPAPRASAYGRAALAAPDDVRPPAARGALAGRFRTAEASALMSGTALVLAVVPDAGPVDPALLGSLATAVRAGGTALVLGPDVPRDVPADRSRPLTVPLRADDALADEWVLLAAGPGKRIAFVARREGDDLWAWSLTRDAVAVQRAGAALLERVPFLRLRVPLLSGR